MQQVAHNALYLMLTVFKIIITNIREDSPDVSTSRLCTCDMHVAYRACTPQMRIYLVQFALKT